jgi:hypothetical protein
MIFENHFSATAAIHSMSTTMARFIPINEDENDVFESLGYPYEALGEGATRSFDAAPTRSYPLPRLQQNLLHDTSSSSSHGLRTPMPTFYPKYSPEKHKRFASSTKKVQQMNLAKFAMGISDYETRTCSETTAALPSPTSIRDCNFICPPLKVHKKEVIWYDSEHYYANRATSCPILPHNFSKTTTEALRPKNRSRNDEDYTCWETL